MNAKLVNKTCPRCKGEGHTLFTSVCSRCNGTGIIAEFENTRPIPEKFTYVFDVNSYIKKAWPDELNHLSYEETIYETEDFKIIIYFSYDNYSGWYSERTPNGLPTPFAVDLHCVNTKSNKSGHLVHMLDSSISYFGHPYASNKEGHCIAHWQGHLPVYEDAVYKFIVSKADMEKLINASKHFGPYISADIELLTYKGHVYKGSYKEFLMNKNIKPISFEGLTDEQIQNINSLINQYKTDNNKGWIEEGLSDEDNKFENESEGKAFAKGYYTGIHSLAEKLIVDNQASKDYLKEIGALL